MTRYVFIDNPSGFVWGDADGDTPEQAALALATATDYDSARDTLARIETARGKWIEYGMDGRMTTGAVDFSDDRDQNPAGTGWRARFHDGLHGGDYGWGPLAETEKDAITLFLAKYVGEIAETE